MIEEIRNHIIKLCEDYNNKYGYDYWNNHIKYVVEISKELAIKKNIDIEIIEISALLHDVALLLEDGPNKGHPINGAKIAEEMLLEYKLNNDKLERIKNCIINHNSDKNADITDEEKCLRNADILSIFRTVSVLYYNAYKEENLSYSEGREYVKNIITKKYLKLDDYLQKEYETTLNIILQSI